MLAQEVETELLRLEAEIAQRQRERDLLMASLQDLDERRVSLMAENLTLAGQLPWPPPKPPPPPDRYLTRLCRRCGRLFVRGRGENARLYCDTCQPIQRRERANARGRRWQERHPETLRAARERSRIRELERRAAARKIREAEEAIHGPRSLPARRCQRCGESYVPERGQGARRYCDPCRAERPHEYARERRERRWLACGQSG